MLARSLAPSTQLFSPHERVNEKAREREKSSGVRFVFISMRGISKISIISLSVSRRLSNFVV
jgi:hypothetical protein